MAVKSTKKIRKSTVRKTGRFFTVIFADKDVKWEINGDQDCKMFVFTGEIDKYEIIPKMTLRQFASRLEEEIKGDVKITESVK